MGQPVTQVDTFGLAKVGSAVTQTSAGYQKAYSSRADALATTGALDGWATGAALTGTARAWESFLSRLSSQVTTVGADLSQAAEEFRVADAAAGNRVTVAGHSPVRLY